MKLTVGGKYSGEYWVAVQETIQKLEKAGHTVLAPKAEWEPQGTIDEVYTKFAGEEKMSRNELQAGFVRAMNEADSHVVVNHNGYIGFTAQWEIGYDAGRIQERKMSYKIYLTEPPLAWELLNPNHVLSFEEFMQEINGNPDKHRDIINVYERQKNDKRATLATFVCFGWEDFYGDIFSLNCIWMGYDILKGRVVIGIDELLQGKETEGNVHKDRCAKFREGMQQQTQPGSRPSGEAYIEDGSYKCSQTNAEQVLEQ